MMKRIINCLAVFIMLLWTNKIWAAGSGLVNGSFEADKWITDISVKEPNGWDVNMPMPPEYKFGGCFE